MLSVGCSLKRIASCLGSGVVVRGPVICVVGVGEVFVSRVRCAILCLLRLAQYAAGLRLACLPRCAALATFFLVYSPASCRVHVLCSSRWLDTCFGPLVVGQELQ